jgi:hypothetical protein
MSSLINPNATFLAVMSATASIKNQANSQITFGLSSPISTATDQEYGEVYLQEFNLMNTLHNLINETQLIVRSTFYNEVTQERTTSDYTIYFPAGNYTYSTMLATLNAVLPSFSNTPYPDTVYGLGGTPTPPIPPSTQFNYPVSKSPIGAYFVFEQYASILNQSFTGQLNEHVYESFQLIFTREVYDLWWRLGLTRFQNPTPGTQFEPVSDYTIFIGVQTRNFNVGTNTTTVTYFVDNQITSPYVFNFAATQNLYVVANGQIPSRFRYPFTENNPSNLIAVIPVTVPYGFQIFYSPQNPAKCSVKNMNLSNLQLSIYDDRGQLINTNGSDIDARFIINFGIDERQDLNVSAITGLPNRLPSSTPSELMHPSAKSYNLPGQRDPLGSSQLNINSSTKRYRPA